MYRHQHGYPDSDPRMLQLEAALEVIARVTVGAGMSMEQQQGQGGLRRGRSASAVVEPERQHSGFGPGACVDARWPGDPYGWHGGHMVQSFANGTHEVVFDDGDRSSAVRHVRVRDHSLSPCMRCAALRLHGVMCAPPDGTQAAILDTGGTPSTASAQTRAYQIVGELGMRLRLELKLRGGGGKCKKKSAA